MTVTAGPHSSAAVASRFGPLSLLAACLLPVVGALAVDDVVIGLWVLALQVTTLGWFLTDPRSTASRLLLGVIAAFSITISTWFYGGQDIGTSLGAACRVLCIVVPAALLTPRIRPSELGDHLAQRLRLAPRVVVAGVVALQRLDSIGEQWSQIQRARRARGLGADGSVGRRLNASAGAAFAMLVASMRATGTLAVAMDARGFTHAHGRTWAEPAPWKWGDTGLLVLALALAVAPWVLRGQL